VGSFTSTYSLTEQRIGAASTLDPATGDYMGNGGVVRLLNVFPATQHQVGAPYTRKIGFYFCIFISAGGRQWSCLSARVVSGIASWAIHTYPHASP
jgi:hypothetical protein